ncbi:hypothetical protein ACW9VW_15520, partial [Lactiplantibacillus plantarum]
TDALFLFSIISKAGLEKFEDFSRPALFLETYVTASFYFFLTCCTLIVNSSLTTCVALVRIEVYGEK